MKKLTLVVFLVLATQGFSTNKGIKKDFEESKFIPGIETIASYYSDYYHNRITANGEIFKQEKLTCAHKTLPFGTMLKVTNLSNKKSIIVRVNDRGPFIKGRDVDLSKAAADSLDMIYEGIVKVKYEVLE